MEILVRGTDPSESAKDVATALIEAGYDVSVATVTYVDPPWFDQWKAADDPVVRRRQRRVVEHVYCPDLTRLNEALNVEYRANHRLVSVTPAGSDYPPHYYLVVWDVLRPTRGTRD